MDARDQIIKLLVGVSPSEIFHVHEGVLCKSSVFFRRSLKPEWAEQREDPYTVDLSDVDIEDIQYYINWLYFGTTPMVLPETSPDADNATIHENAHKAFIPLARAYVFGEKFLDVKYKNFVIESILAVRYASRWSPGPECAAIIYEGTSPGSPARRLLADLMAHGAHDHDSDETVGWMTYIEDLPHEALVDAMKAIVKARPIVGTFDPSNALYLEKEED